MRQSQSGKRHGAHPNAELFTDGEAYERMTDSYLRHNLGGLPLKLHSRSALCHALSANVDSNTTMRTAAESAKLCSG